MEASKVKSVLWLKSNGEDAAKLYTSLIPNSHIAKVNKMPGVTLIDFTLGGAPYQIMDCQTDISPTTFFSIQVQTEDQDETDRLWCALLADGGSESRCSWLTDRFGVSWQIVPKALPQYVGGSDPEGAKRAMMAMMQMNKINIAALEAAYRGEEK